MNNQNSNLREFAAKWIFLISIALGAFAAFEVENLTGLSGGGLLSCQVAVLIATIIPGGAAFVRMQNPAAEVAVK